MTDPNAKKHRTILQRIARRAMLERGLLPEFSPQALAELETMQGHVASRRPDARSAASDLVLH